jgi:protein gp37
MDKTKIEWCDSTWNPITGCYHGCPYCYARKIANQFAGGVAHHEEKRSDGLHDLFQPVMVLRGGKRMAAPFPFAFEPTLYRYRLDDYIRKERPRNIFVCSTADLFGDWIPDEWIEEVFESCKRGAQHRYLFLTKNPERYVRLAEAGKLPEADNMWYGTTTTTPETLFFYGKKYHTFVSIEPILAPFTNLVDIGVPAATHCDWIILGAETGNRKDKVEPTCEWFSEVVKSAAETHTPVFMKDSLTEIVGEENMLRQFPWEEAYCK